MICNQLMPSLAFNLGSGADMFFLEHDLPKDDLVGLTSGVKRVV